MKAKDLKEIAFWKQAIKKIRKEYGEPCNVFEIDCVGCRANLVVDWIENYIGVMESFAYLKKPKTIRMARG